MKAICIGGELDGKIVDPFPIPNDYIMHQLGDSEQLILNYYVHKDLTYRAAIHKVFVAYEKKAKVK